VHPHQRLHVRHDGRRCSRLPVVADTAEVAGGPHDSQRKQEDHGQGGDHDLVRHAQALGQLRREHREFHLRLRQQGRGPLDVQLRGDCVAPAGRTLQPGQREHLRVGHPGLLVQVGYGQGLGNKHGQVGHCAGNPL